MDTLYTMIHIYKTKLIIIEVNAFEKMTVVSNFYKYEVQCTVYIFAKKYTTIIIIHFIKNKSYTVG